MEDCREGRVEIKRLSFENLLPLRGEDPLRGVLGCLNKEFRAGEIFSIKLKEFASPGIAVRVVDGFSP